MHQGRAKQFKSSGRRSQTSSETLKNSDLQVKNNVKKLRLWIENMNFLKGFRGVLHLMCFDLNCKYTRT